MAVLSIRIIGDPVLRTPAAEVTGFGPDLARLVADMTETMDDVQGAGLAAPQVGISLRVFTFRIGNASGYVVNPLLNVGAEVAPDDTEGCLSIPGLGYPVERANWARVTGLDVDGQAVEYEATGMLARCFQHETDHLNGSLYIQRLVGEHRKAAMRAIRSSTYSAVADRTARERAQSIGSSFGFGSATAQAAGQPTGRPTGHGTRQP
ncbi:peptide deformylase [Arthrobacter sp. HLT1-21]